MNRILFGILSKGVGDERCTYPLDATFNQMSALGFQYFTHQDSCGHDLIAEGSGVFGAISKESAEALLTNSPIPSTSILPPNALGLGVYAVEFDVGVSDDNGGLGVYTISVGGYRPLNPEHGGGIINILYSPHYGLSVSCQALDVSIDRAFEGRFSIRVGIYYNNETNEVGFIADGEDIGYVGKYSTTEPLILAASKREIADPDNPLIAKVGIGAFTKGEDLEFFYPEGTVGLDGEPAKNSYSGCSYKFDMTNFRQIENVLNLPAGSISTPTYFDTAKQRFKVKMGSEMESQIVVAAMNGSEMVNGEIVYPNTSVLPLNFCFAYRYNIIQLGEGVGVDGLKLALGMIYEGETRTYEYGMSIYELGENIKFPWHDSANEPDEIKTIPQEATLLFLFDGTYTRIYMDGELVGTGYNNKIYRGDEINWGFYHVEEYKPNIEYDVELITDARTLSTLLDGVTDIDHLNPKTICGSEIKYYHLPVTNTITFIPVARPDNTNNVQYYVGDIEADPNPIGILVDNSGWRVGRVKLVSSSHQPESTLPYVNTIRVLLEPTEAIPTRFEISINGKVISTSAKFIQPSATEYMLSFITIMDEQEDLFTTEVQYTVEVTTYYD